MKKKVMNIKPQEVTENGERSVRYKGSDGKMHEVASAGGGGGSAPSPAIENNPNAYAISARLAGKDRPIPSDYTYSSNRIVAQNVCDSQIQLEGNDVVPDNGNYLGTNIMLNADGAVTRHLAGQEEQILSPLSRLEGGFFRSRISLINWNM